MRIQDNYGNARVAAARAGELRLQKCSNPTQVVSKDISKSVSWVLLSYLLPKITDLFLDRVETLVEHLLSLYISELWGPGFEFSQV
jgi:hypothetical protein